MQALLAPCEGGPPDRLIEAGVGMAGGNPGLLEHMVRIFHDSGVLKDVGDNARPARLAGGSRPTGTGEASAHGRRRRLGAPRRARAA